MPTPETTILTESAVSEIEARTCSQCGRIINIAEACAIAKTSVIFYYCPPCYEIVVNEN